MVVLAAALFCASTAAADLRINLDPPGPREFILDRANKLDSGTQDRLRSTCDRLLTDEAIPIVIVTINSMAEHGGGAYASRPSLGSCLTSGRLA